MGYVCADDVEDAYDACGELCGDVDAEYAIDFRLNPETMVPCVENAASMTCGSWDPDAEIDYYTGPGYYGMDWGFVAGLLANPEPLWACDDANFIAASGGGFEVADASSGEFLYELGLRNGDKIVSINNVDIDSYVDVGYAFATLWGQTSFTLEIVRSSTPMELDYVLFVTL